MFEIDFKIIEVSLLARAKGVNILMIANLRRIRIYSSPNIENSEIITIIITMKLR